MSRSVPDDDMMDAQQARDLGHATKSQLAQVATEKLPQAEDWRVRRFNTLIPPDRETEAAEALLRAAYPPGRRATAP